MSKENNKGKRGAGILLPISSLPSNYGIGTFGKEAYEFVEQLAVAKQKYWQVLPMGPTSYGDSPYQSFSAFAGNPYFIDLDILIEEDLLKKKEVEAFEWGNNESKVDYEIIYKNRFKILRTAFKNSTHETSKEYQEYCENNKFWLSDYCLYMAVKNSFDNKEWLLWDVDIRNREPKAVKEYEIKFDEDIRFWKFCQFKFNEQWVKLKAFAAKNDIKIIGDIPLYVAMDSADVWVHGRLFELDERKNPIHIAGVPPDSFSKTGQRWGNPLYRWDVMEKEDFAWWKKRMATNASLYDVIRIDHFIGIVRYFCIPESCKTAEIGEYQKGPGSKLTDAIREAIGSSEIIAEDLGVVVPSVRELISQTGWPGMKILEFAYDGGTDNDNLPFNYTTPNCIVYGGTHDNETLEGFFQAQKISELEYVMDYLNVARREDLTDAIIRSAYESIANVAIFQLQDILKLDNRARMNFPGTVGGNWEWRLKKGQFEAKHREQLKKLVSIYGR